MSSKIKTCHLKRMFGAFLWSRRMAVELRDAILKGAQGKIIIDFRGVTLMNHAFTDELLKMKRLLEQKDFIIIFERVEPSAALMLSHFEKHASGTTP